MASLFHPSLVNLNYCFQTPEAVFMILDLVQGGDMEGFQANFMHTAPSQAQVQTSSTTYNVSIHTPNVFLHIYTYVEMILDLVQGGDMEGFQASFMHTAPSQAQVHNSSTTYNVSIHTPNVCLHIYTYVDNDPRPGAGWRHGGFQANFMHTAPSQAQVYIACTYTI